MLHAARILVCEDEPFIALDVASAIEDAGGIVVGPAATVREAKSLLEIHSVVGAILDVHLAGRDVTSIAEVLLAKNIPVIFQTGLQLPDAFVARWSGLYVFKKPTRPELLVKKLSLQLSDPELVPKLRLGEEPP